MIRATALLARTTKGRCPTPAWRAKLWRHCRFLWWERSEDLRRAHDALGHLHSAAQQHLTRPSIENRMALRAAYEAAGRREEEVLPVRKEIERAHEVARRAMLDYLDDLITDKPHRHPTGLPEGS